MQLSIFGCNEDLGARGAFRVKNSGNRGVLSCMGTVVVAAQSLTRSSYERASRTGPGFIFRINFSICVRVSCDNGGCGGVRMGGNRLTGSPLI